MLNYFLVHPRSRKKQFDERSVERERSVTICWCRIRATAFASFFPRKRSAAVDSVKCRAHHRRPLPVARKTPKRANRMKNDSGTETESVADQRGMADWDGRDCPQRLQRRPAVRKVKVLSFPIPILTTAAGIGGMADATRAHDREKALRRRWPMASAPRGHIRTFCQLSHDIRTPRMRSSTDRLFA